jgi:hypothetical protein
MKIDTILSLIQTIVGLVAFILTIVLPQKQGNSFHFHQDRYINVIAKDDDINGNKPSNGTTSSTSTDPYLQAALFVGIMIISAFAFFEFQKIFFTLTSLLVVGTVVCISIAIREKSYLLSTSHKFDLYLVLFFMLVSTIFIPINKVTDGYNDFIKEWMNVSATLGFRNINILMKSIADIFLSFVKLSCHDKITGYFIFFKAVGFVYLLHNVKRMLNVFIKLIKEKPIKFKPKQITTDIVFSLVALLFLSGGWLIIFENYLRPFFIPK